MDPVTRYLEEHRDRFVEDLKACLRIPSISAKSEHRNDCRRCADFLTGELRKVGMTRAETVSTAGHPVVYGEWLGAPGKPTTLLYGHYDVQPPEPLELWRTPPFDPVVQDGKLFARGAVDDKGQVYMHLKAIEAHMKVNGALPVNLKVVLEGEEEVGSEHLASFLHEQRKRLDADVIVVSDTAMLGPDQPALTYGLRGMLYTQIEVTGPSHDLHSGHFGGAVQNPANALAGIIAGLKDAQGRITVPGFYDAVRPLTEAERAMMKTLPFDEKAYLAEAGAPQPFGETGYSTYERMTSRPTLDVNGMWSGYTGEGSKTVLPSFAAAKVSMRLVPAQDPDVLFRAFEKHVRGLAPPGVTLKIVDMHSAPPWTCDPADPMLVAARRALSRAWTKPVALIKEGGSIPVMATFAETHPGLPAIMIGFGLDDDNVHAPNEKFSLSSYHGGTRSVAYLYEELAKG